MILTNLKNIIFEDVNLAFEAELLSDVSAEFKTGKITCIVGESGSGKSSLLKLILGLLTADSGLIKVSDLILNQENISKIRELIAWIPNSDVNFPDVNIKNFVSNLNLDLELFENNLKNFKLNKDIIIKTFTQISSGEKQRIFLAVADYFNRDIWLGDEITSSLDKENKAIVLEFLKKSGKTIICATHDKDLIDIADEVYSIKNKRLVYGL